jgi:dihydropteroate synthase
MILASNPSSEIEDKLFPLKYTLQIKGRLVCLKRPQIMGILNLTPDSFFGESRVLGSREVLIEKVTKMVSEGADMLDLGGYSTRPGAVDVTLEEEIQRIVPAVEWIAEAFPSVLISVDTFRAKVAEAAVSSGAHLVNDISAGSLDPKMLETVGKLEIPYIAMHMRGNPQTMQKKTNYSDILVELLNYFAEKTALCRKFGIKDVIIDPGFGFAKTIDQNYWILRNLKYFQALSLPILAGVSRKSMIYKTLGVSPEEALNGSTALHIYALTQGANILRVHDVKEAKETLTLYHQLYP